MRRFALAFLLLSCILGAMLSGCTQYREPGAKATPPAGGLGNSTSPSPSPAANTTTPASPGASPAVYTPTGAKMNMPAWQVNDVFVFEDRVSATQTAQRTSTIAAKESRPLGASKVEVFRIEDRGPVTNITTYRATSTLALLEQSTSRPTEAGPATTRLTFEKPCLQVPYPLQAGKTWTIDCSGTVETRLGANSVTDHFRYRGTGTAIGWESIVVGGGQFDAIRYHLNLTRENDAGTTNQSYDGLASPEGCGEVAFFNGTTRTSQLVELHACEGPQGSGIEGRP